MSKSQVNCLHTWYHLHQNFCWDWWEIFTIHIQPFQCKVLAVCNLVENALYLLRSELCSNFDFLQSDHGLCQDIRGDVGQIRANDVQPPQLDVLTAGDLVKQSQRLVSRKPFSINILNRDQGISENNRRNKWSFSKTLVYYNDRSGVYILFTIMINQECIYCYWLSRCIRSG